MEAWIDSIRAMKRTASDRAKKRYGEIALRMAFNDGVLKMQGVNAD